MKPSEFPEVRLYPAIAKFLQTQVDMLFEDIRSMLLLPLSRCEGGCNFSAADFICDVISGISAVLYKPDEGIDKDRFKELMQNYYPWKEEGFDPQKGTEIIWNWMRNPITHRLGLVLPAKGERPVVVAKSPLNIRQIEELEDISKQIKIKTIEVKEDGTYLINVLGFYRGLHKMLKNLFGDKNQMQRTNKYWGKN